MDILGIVCFLVRVFTVDIARECMSSYSGEKQDSILSNRKVGWCLQNV